MPVHAEFLLIGWTLQFAMGVAYWILPRFQGGASRASEAAARAAFILLNAGLWLPLLAAIPRLSPVAHVLGRSAEVLAALAFLIHAWPRVKAPSA
jgi:heme/copper-type cytochrome/quinol oxidase subunit 1